MKCHKKFFFAWSVDRWYVIWWWWYLRLNTLGKRPPFHFGLVVHVRYLLLQSFPIHFLLFKYLLSTVIFAILLQFWWSLYFAAIFTGASQGLNKFFMLALVCPEIKVKVVEICCPQDCAVGGNRIEPAAIEMDHPAFYIFRGLVKPGGLGGEISK